MEVRIVDDHKKYDSFCKTYYIFNIHRTSAYDAKNHLLYLQMHLDDGSGTFTEAICKIGFFQNHVTGKWYGYINTAMWPMNFGYSGYQFASIKQ